MALAVSVAALVGAGLTGTSAAAADTPSSGLGQEPYRPYLHFSPDENWTNDPNGLVYYKGVYHLFFQHNPYGIDWGNTSWGHATSPDLMHWTMQPVAIPQGEHEYIYSGSAVVDRDNTSGFGTKANPPMVAIYTSQYHDDPTYGNREAQSLAYSVDDGMTWTKYSGNPVLDLNRGDFRDPKVFWYGSRSDGYWVMVAVEADASTIVLSKSKDLRHWEQMSTFSSDTVPGFWECPDLFPLQLDGDPAKTRWVMEMSTAAAHQSYIVGDFDGTTFTEDTSSANAPLPAGDVLESFDDGSYDGWSVLNDPTSPAGGPFGRAPASGAIGGQQKVTGFAGTGVVNSFLDGDSPIGSLVSPDFTIDSSYINFLIGGGNHPRQPGTGSGEAPPGTTLFDFEEPAGRTLADDGWTGTGDLAASDQPARPHPQPNVAQGFQGNGYLSTFYAPNGDDNATGTLTSPAFTIDTKYIDLLVGGGERDDSSGQTLAVQLLIGGKVVQSETGTNAHLMNWRSWDVSGHQGESAQLRVVDTATGGWGAIWVDDVVGSDRPALPRSTETTVDLIVDGQTVRSTTGPSNDGDVGPAAEFLNWASWDVSQFKGKTAHIAIIDNNTGGFGHILADQFMTSDQPAKANPAPILNQLDWGRDDYASNTYNDAPDGKRISIGWMGQAFTSPTSPWRGNMTLPRELSLQTIDGRPQIVTRFVDQLADYEKDFAAYTVRPGDVAQGVTILPPQADGAVQRIEAVLTPETASRFGVVVRGDGGSVGTRIGYDTATSSVYIDRSASGLIPAPDQFDSPNAAPVSLVDGKLTLDIVVDRGSVEVIAGDGQRILTNMIYPADSDTKVALYADGGTARVDSMKVIPMYGSVWDPQPRLSVPGAPADVRARADAHGTVHVAWKAPNDTGGAEITGYRVFASAVDDGARSRRSAAVAAAVADPAPVCTSTGTATACDAAGLSPGVYTFTVDAENVVGVGARSDPSNAVTVGTADPGARGAAAGPGSGGASGLAATGSDVAAAAIGALVLLAAGAAAFSVRRRRTTR